MNTNKIILIGCEDTGRVARALAEFCNDGGEKKTVISIEFQNEVSVGDDGWAQIAPYGDYIGMANVPQPDGTYKRELAIQRMDKQAVTEMVNEYDQARKGLLKKFLNGRPLYLGHPDAPKPCGHQADMSNCGPCITHARKYPDKTPKGVFARLAAREDGFYGEPVLTEEGAELVASGKAKFLSGRWLTEITNETVQRDGQTMRVFRPSVFMSAGLTNSPRLPVQMMNEAESESESDLLTKTLAAKQNAAAAQQKEKHMKKKLIAALAIAGITFANEAEATDEKLENGIEQLRQKAEKATQFENEVPTLKADVTAKVTEIGTLKNECATAKTSFENERTQLIQRVLGTGLKAGKITDAEKADWQRRLENKATFANELEAFDKLPEGKVKVTSLTIDRGGRKVELANSGQRTEMVNELMDEVANEKKWDRKKDHTRIFNEVQKRHPALFEGMKQPNR